MKFSKTNKKLVSIVSATAVLVMLMGTSLWACYSPYSYVSVDGNPSIEYTVNRFDKIIDAKGLNDEGIAVLANLDLKNMNIKSAVKETVQQIAEMDLFSPVEDNALVVTASSKDEAKAEELTQQLKDNAQLAVDENAVNAEVSCNKIGYDRVKEANKLGVAPGKLNLVQKLAECSENPKTFVINDWLNKSVKDIMKEIKLNRGKSHFYKDEPKTTATTQIDPTATSQVDPTATTQIDPTATTQVDPTATTQIDPSATSKPTSSSTALPSNTNSKDCKNKDKNDDKNNHNHNYTNNGNHYGYKNDYDHDNNNDNSQGCKD